MIYFQKRKNELNLMVLELFKSLYAKQLGKNYLKKNLFQKKNYDSSINLSEPSINETITGQKKNYSKHFVLKPSKLFLKQLKILSDKSKLILEKKLLLAKENPFRNKRIKGYSLFLFRVRFEDGRKEKRVIYFIQKNKILIVCILDRDKNYSDLKKYLTKYS